MLTIKFSKYYKKLPALANGKQAILLFVREVELGNQVSHFLNYDCEAIDGTSYELPQVGRYLLLLFELEGTIFTTLRRSTPDKKDYYTRERGNKFTVAIE